MEQASEHVMLISSALRAGNCGAIAPAWKLQAQMAVSGGTRSSHKKSNSEMEMRLGTPKLNGRGCCVSAIENLITSRDVQSPGFHTCSYHIMANIGRYNAVFWC